MTYNTKNNHTRISLAYLLGNDVLRDIKSTDTSENYLLDENDNPEMIIDSIPVIDIGRNLSDETRKLLERTADITRSYNLDEIKVVHLFQALLDNSYISRLMKDYAIDSEQIKNSLKSTSDKNKLIEAETRRTQLVLSLEVEEILKDSLNLVAEDTELLIEPHHLFVTLLEKDYSPITQIIRTQEKEINSLIFRIKDENNQSY